jgi:Type I phosphodiesterase / nucleotide pyrophosphatase
MAVMTLAVCSAVSCFAQPAQVSATPPETSSGPTRLIILKVDGLNGDLLYRTMSQTDPNTGKSKLPWLSHIFSDDGIIFDNFFTRGISLSAPSWSMLDTGRHSVIRGNVEYDRYTGRVYDYLNFFPFVYNYIWLTQVDMPGVQVLDAAGIPMLIDRYAYNQQFQGIQLYQRGLRWTTLGYGLEHRLSKDYVLSVLEQPQAGFRLAEGLNEQTTVEMLERIKGNQTLYLDYFTGEFDHIAHASSSPEILFKELQKLDTLAGRIWTAVQSSPLADRTLFVMVSDHGMNNTSGVYSQGYNLPDLFNSPAAGAHHVVTNRQQLDQFKLAGMEPMVIRVINPSNASFYLAGESQQYPTAWLDLDGNERASVQLRNSDLNRIHILLLQLKRTDLPAPVRRAAVREVDATISRYRDSWTTTAASLQAEIDALGPAIEARKLLLKKIPKDYRKWPKEEVAVGADKKARREMAEFAAWEIERKAYQSYIDHLRALLALRLDPEHPLNANISHLIPQLSLGDRNSVFDLQNYVAGPGPAGLVLDAGGNLDEAQSFRHVNYFPLLISQRVRNVPQRELSAQPIEFLAVRLSADGLPPSLWEGGPPPDFGIWLYADGDHQLLELVSNARGAEEIRLVPVSHLSQARDGKVTYDTGSWTDGLPFHLPEDKGLRLPDGAPADNWLSQWHSEDEWMRATYGCQYTNGVIGITEELLPMADALPAHESGAPLLRQLELRRRELVEADFHVFANDHWNFNARNFNPGGNHGSFLRISTHSVWMMAGAGLASGVHYTDPVDTLYFGSTVLHIVGKEPPMPKRVLALPTRRPDAANPTD